MSRQSFCFLSFELSLVYLIWFHFLFWRCDWNKLAVLLCVYLLNPCWLKGKMRRRGEVSSPPGVPGGQVCRSKAIDFGRLLNSRLVQQNEIGQLIFMEPTRHKRSTATGQQTGKKNGQSLKIKNEYSHYCHLLNTLTKTDGSTCNQISQIRWRKRSTGHALEHFVPALTRWPHLLQLICTITHTNTTVNQLATTRVGFSNYRFL